MELHYIDGFDAIIFGLADLPFECSFCGEQYKEHEDFESFFEGIFDEHGKITCCKNCFETNNTKI